MLKSFSTPAEIEKLPVH